ncbi:MAG: glycosyltransferase involved in cell wall biosynthesis [Arcticibacterium sp.]|jgi:glycosyltransferase involved in cell wall biosynthesis
MRILLIHQFLWSHYKAGIFKELETLFQSNPDDAIHIIQTAKYEKSRLDFGEADTSIHTYNYELLYDGIYEDTSIFFRIKKVFNRIRAFKPTIVTLPGYYDPAMVCIHFLCKIMGIKVTLSVDSTESDNPNIWYAELVKKFIVFLTDGFFCYGTKSANYILKLGAPESKILLRRNSVNNDFVEKVHSNYKSSVEYDIERKQYPKYNFIFVGRFLKLKNLKLLLESFSSLSSAQEWGIILVGDGPEKEALMISYESNQNIFFLAPQDWKSVPKKMALADVLILPSYSEPWGLVTNEAMVCKMPIIISNQCGSAADLVENNINGFTFDAYSKNELITRMQFFVNSPDQLNQFGEISSKKIKEFSPLIVAQEMFKGYKKIK